MFQSRFFILLVAGIGLSMANSIANPPQIGGKIAKVPVEQEVGDISGYYTCQGEEASGKRYFGITAIAKKGEVYLVSWTIGIGSSFTGIGIRQGDTLAVSWAMTTKDGLMRGINFYKIRPGPSLVGHWATLPGNGRIQKEDLKFLAPLMVEED